MLNVLAETPGWSPPVNRFIQFLTQSLDQLFVALADVLNIETRRPQPIRVLSIEEQRRRAMLRRQR